MNGEALQNVARFVADSYLVPATLRAVAKTAMPTDAELEKRYREFRRIYARSVLNGRVNERSTIAQTREQLHRPLLALFGFDPMQLHAREVELDPGTANLAAFGDDESLLVDAMPYALRADDRLTSGGFKGSPHRRMLRALAAGGSRFGLLLGGSAWRVIALDTANEPRYLEFDLDALAEGNAVEDFAIFATIVAPQSLLGADPLLAQLQAASDALGTEVSDKLGPATRRALERLLEGVRIDEGNAAWAPQTFVEGPALQNIYKQGVYVLYRLLFVLFGEAASPPALPVDKPLYREAYSLERLRHDVAGDLGAFAENSYGIWESVKALFRLIDRGARTKEFTVPTYNGGLFGKGRTELLDHASLNDRAFAEVLRDLTTVTVGKGKHRALNQVSFRELGVAQLGAVFEGLLDYEPHIAAQDLYETMIGSGKQKGVSYLPASALSKRPDGPPQKRTGEFYLRAWGGQRKSTGAYYTPKVIADYLVREALGPQIKETRAEDILGLTVCDPAMGSGGFLVSATEFLGEAYYQALVREGARDPDDDNADADRLAAKRAVAERCIYGVDMNPMAVELAKVSLWLTTLSYDRPLSFFDHHLRCGNSLLGAPLRDDDGQLTALRIDSVPQEALKSVDKEATDVEKKRLAATIKRNAAQRAALEKGGGLGLFTLDLSQPLAEYARRRRELTADDAIEPAATAAERNRAKERMLRALTQPPDSSFARIKELCDLWMSVWFWPFDAPADPPTTDELRAIQAAIWSNDGLAAGLQAQREIARAAAQDVRFFHWELEFPEVFESGGFHAIVGNPPWEMLNAETREFFVNLDPSFTSLSKQRAVAAMATFRQDPAIDALFRQYARRVNQVSAFARESKLFPWLSEDGGKVDTFRAFIERDFRSLRASGRCGVVLPSGFYINDTCSRLRRGLVEQGAIEAMIVNPNERFAFPIHHALKPVFLIIARGIIAPTIPTAFFTGKDDDGRWRALDLEALSSFLSAPKGKMIDLPISLIRAISPETFAIPEIRDPMDARVIEHLLKSGTRFNALSALNSSRKVNMTSESDLFRDREYLEKIGAHCDGLRWRHAKCGEFWPVVEGKHLYQLEFPVGEFRYWISVREVQNLTKFKQLAGEKSIRIAWRDVASNTNERSMIAALVPKLTFLGNTLQCIVLEPKLEAKSETIACLLNTLLFDWQVRARGSTHLTLPLVSELPVPRNLINTTLSSRDRLGSEVSVLASYDLPFDFAEHVLAGFTLLDRLQRSLEGEARSTITRDLVLAAYAERLSHPKAGYYRERADRATKLGAVPFVPATREEGMADDLGDDE